MKHKLIEIFGWYGMVAIIGAYALSSFGVLEPNTLLYQLLNLSGAVGIVCVSFTKKAYQPGVLNTIWAVIASLAIGRLLFGR